METGIWVASATVVLLLAPWWLGWRWGGGFAEQAVGGCFATAAIESQAIGRMGLSRLDLASALFPLGVGAEENGLPQRLVVKGPYRYVRNPIYGVDTCAIVGTTPHP